MVWRGAWGSGGIVLNYNAIQRLMAESEKKKILLLFLNSLYFCMGTRLTEEKTIHIVSFRYIPAHVQMTRRRKLTAMYRYKTDLRANQFSSSGFSRGMLHIIF